MVSNLKVNLETNFVLDLISLGCRLRLLSFFFREISLKRYGFIFFLLLLPV